MSNSAELGYGQQQQVGCLSQIFLLPAQFPQAGQVQALERDTTCCGIWPSLAPCVAFHHNWRPWTSGGNAMEGGGSRDPPAVAAAKPGTLHNCFLQLLATAGHEQSWGFPCLQVSWEQQWQEQVSPSSPAPCLVPDQPEAPAMPWTSQETQASWAMGNWCL